MARLGDQARIVIGELASTPVSFESPLEDQVILVFRAVRRFAEINGFKEQEWGGRPGRAGPFVMKWFEEQLFPGVNKDQLELLSSRIGKALRVSGAAVCLKRPAKQGDMPVWFVANNMPDDIVSIAQSVAQGSTVYKRRRDESELLNRNEKRLTPQEAGETQEPGEVMTKRTDSPADYLSTVHEERRVRREKTKELVYEQIATSPIPLRAKEISVLMPEDFKTEVTTVRSCIRELEEEGKIVGRQETIDEKRVRGAGGMPAGQRAWLYVAAPGPVPERTRLPDGIEPTVPMAEHNARRRDKRQGAELKILDYLTHRAVAEGRTLGKIHDRVSEPGETTADTKARLVSMANRNLIHRDGGHRYYAGPPNKRTQSAAAEEDTIARIVGEAEPTPEPQPAELVLTGPSITDDPRVRQLLELLSEIVATPGEDTEALKREIDRLKAENAQLQEAVDGLKRAIASGVV